MAQDPGEHVKSIPSCLVLTLVTCGLYNFYWQYRQMLAVNEMLAEQKYTTVRHVGGEDLVEDSLRQLETEFGSRFLRVHRGALVNRDFLEAIERREDGGYEARVRGLDEPLPVSRRLAGELKTRL